MPRARGGRMNNEEAAAASLSSTGGRCSQEQHQQRRLLGRSTREQQAWRVSGLPWLKGQVELCGVLWLAVAGGTPPIVDGTVVVKARHGLFRSRGRGRLTTWPPAPAGRFRAQQGSEWWRRRLMHHGPNFAGRAWSARGSWLPKQNDQHQGCLGHGAVALQNTKAARVEINLGMRRRDRGADTSSGSLERSAKGWPRRSPLETEFPQNGGRVAR